MYSVHVKLILFSSFNFFLSFVTSVGVTFDHKGAQMHGNIDFYWSNRVRKLVSRETNRAV